MARIRKYEVGVYNSVVRERVERGEHHKHFDDSWSDIHYEEIEAKTPEQARSKVNVRLPANRGFVIVDVK